MTVVSSCDRIIVARNLNFQEPHVVSSFGYLREVLGVKSVFYNVGFGIYKSVFYFLYDVIHEYFVSDIWRCGLYFVFVYSYLPPYKVATTLTVFGFI